MSAIKEYITGPTIFHNRKLILVGDTFLLFRPHARSSTNQAAKHVLGLAEIFREKCNLKEWEIQSLKYTKKTNALNNFFGEYCFTGKVPKGLNTTIKEDNKSD